MAATPPKLPPDPKRAIQYAKLVQLAEAVKPDQTVYNPSVKINIAYDTINVDYTVVTTFYGNDLATEKSLAQPFRIVSFGFVAQDGEGNVVVSVRGTSDIWEWVQDARFLAVKCPFLAGAGLTEDGFTAVYESLHVGQGATTQRLVNALAEMKFPHPVTSLTICGHSLGGALVTLMALDVAANTKLPNPTVYSYASPRTGNPQFVETYNQVVPNTIRIFNRYDIVPRVPAPPLYGHVLEPYELHELLKVKPEIFCQHHLTTYLYLLSLKVPGGAVLPLNEECKPPMVLEKP